MSEDKTKTGTDGHYEQFIETDDDGRRVEIWPSFECIICSSDPDQIRWETTSIPEDNKDHPEYYTGRKPCCYRCGAAVPDEHIDEHRPEEWKQAIIRVIHSIAGLSTNHPGVDGIYSEYERDPEAFLQADASELASIEGIGAGWSDKIQTNKASLYPQHTPDVDGVIYDFRGRRVTDVSPSQIANDIAMQFVTIEDLPHTSKNDSVITHLEKVAEILDSGDVPTPAIPQDEGEQIGAELKQKLPR